MIIKDHPLQTSMSQLKGLFLFALQSCALLPDHLLSPLHIKFGTCVSFEELVKN